MKSALAAIATATILTVAAHTSAQAGMVSTHTAKSAIGTSSAGATGSLVHQIRGGRGRGIATGLAIGLGVVGAIAASRAYADRRYYVESYEESHAYRCRRWYRQCHAGSDRACWRFERSC